MLPPIQFDSENPLIPQPAHEALRRLNALTGAEISITKPASGDTGVQAFKPTGDRLTLELPLRSPTVLPSLDTTGALTFSATPTQAELEALYAWELAQFRRINELIGILRQAQFPS